jgi:hypothetical protein
MQAGETVRPALVQITSIASLAVQLKRWRPFSMKAFPNNRVPVSSMVIANDCFPAWVSIQL